MKPWGPKSRYGEIFNLTMARKAPKTQANRLSSRREFEISPRWECWAHSIIAEKKIFTATRISISPRRDMEFLILKVWSAHAKEKEYLRSSKQWITQILIAEDVRERSWWSRAGFWWFPTNSCSSSLLYSYWALNCGCF